MSGWSYEIFTSSDFNQFNQKLKRALDSLVDQGLVPTVSYSHAMTPSGVSYSAIVLGVPAHSGAVVPSRPD